MRFVTNMPGQYENGAWRDEFTLFFNTSAQLDCSGGSTDPNDPTDPQDCSVATLVGTQRDIDTFNVSASAGNEEELVIDAA
jgi:hypothetical protein